MQIKKIFSSWQVWVLILFLLGSVWAINLNFNPSGVKIISIEKNSSAESNGIKADLIINSLNGQPIKNLEDFTKLASAIKPEDIIKISTNSGEYSFIAKEKNGETSIGISVENIPSSNLKKGLELEGGIRVLLKPENATSQNLQDIITVTEKRLNTYGISDIVVRQAGDFEGNKYILVEIPGANKEQAADLISKQGKFEAKIGNETIFSGGSDIKGVCRSPECSGIDPRAGCGETSNGWSCRFQFRVDISNEAAKRHAAATNQLEIINQDGEEYLSQKLDLYLDNELVDSLFISSDLKGSDSTSFVIQGPGVGATKIDAQLDSLDRMKEMQTVLITGSLPVKLEIAKMDIISPTLGKDFLKITLMTFLLAVIAVGAVLFIKYRNIKITLLIMFTCLCEIFIILGVAAAIRWRLDLASLAGILATIGTGVDDQIVMTDEIKTGEKKESSWKQRIKNAFAIIFCAYFTTVVALLPLGWIGAGMVKGFAITTIIGISVGVFVTRPAFAKIAEVLLK